MVDSSDATYLLEQRAEQFNHQRNLSQARQRQRHGLLLYHVRQNLLFSSN